MYKMRRFFIRLFTVTALVSIICACAIIESTKFELVKIIPWIIISIGSIFATSIINKPYKFIKYFKAFYICLLAWLYIHKFVHIKNAKYCATMKHHYHSYTNLYQRVIQYYNEVRDITII